VRTGEGLRWRAEVVGLARQRVGGAAGCGDAGRRLESREVLGCVGLQPVMQRSDVYVTDVRVTDKQTVSQEIEQARSSSARHSEPKALQMLELGRTSTGTLARRMSCSPVRR
jgi:hypothetical protein